MFPELFEARMKSLLGAEYDEFLASYDRPRNVGLRVNPLKTEQVPDLSRFGLTPVPRQYDNPCRQRRYIIET